MKRIFAAIDLPGNVKRQAAAYVAGLKAAFPQVPARWERENKLHVTIKFAGDLDDERLERFVADVRRAASACPRFEIGLAGTGAFLRSHGPNVLYLNLEVAQKQGDTDPLTKLAAELAGGASGKRRKFTPHLTIARFKDAGKCRQMVDRHLGSDFGPINFIADEIVVYESKLLPGGSEYTVLSRYPLLSAE